MLHTLRTRVHQRDLSHQWCRRLIHYTGALLILYFIIPNTGILLQLKLFLPPLIISIVICADILRIKRNLSFPPDDLFRGYEQNRLGSYVYFGLGAVILFFFFPAQIAIPCILCTSITDPVMGELKRKVDCRSTIIGGLLISAFFFIFVWIDLSFVILIFLTLVGSATVVFSEYISGYWIDDDLLMQILPASIIYIISIMLSIDALLSPVSMINYLI